MKNHPEGIWHETLRPEGSTRSSSNRSFGLTFAGVCAVIAVMGLWRGRAGGLGWLVAAVVFLGLALFAHPLLAPLDRVWQWIGLQLAKLVNPLVMAVMFFGVLAPLGCLMRLTGKDPLRLRFDRAAASYWLNRPGAAGERQTEMNRQF